MTGESPARDGWMAEALCAGLPFFHDPAQLEASLAVCNSEPCPVRRDCYRWAQADRDYQGIAGGRVFRIRETRSIQPLSQDWSEADMRAAHALFVEGKHPRTDWVLEGERAYQAARKREQRRAKRDAA